MSFPGGKTVHEGVFKAIAAEFPSRYTVDDLRER
jgi:hypothetical protein